MAKVKKQKRKSSYSSDLHIPKHRTIMSGCSTPFAKKLILVIIFISIILVIVAVICSIFLDNEKLVKSRISSLATDYYENYFYENLISSEEFKQTDSLDANMEKYHNYGLAPIALRNLLLYDSEKNLQYRDYLTEYCDEDSTYVKFYMDPPYDRTSYHYDITYSCNF